MIIKNGHFDKPFSRDYISKVGLFADVHIGYTSWGDYSKLTGIVNKMNELAPDFCFILGDCVDSGYSSTPELMAEQLGILDNHFSKLNSPIIRMKGNHDNAVDRFTDFGVVTFNGQRFVIIYPKYVGMPSTPKFEYNSRGKLSEEEITKISEMLADGEGYNNIILSHYSVIGNDLDNFSFPICDTVIDISGNVVDGHRDDLVALCTQNKVDLFINGHEHRKGLPNAKADDGIMTDVQIGTTGVSFALLTIYNDRYLFEEYDSITLTKINELTINRAY